MKQWTSYLRALVLGFYLINGCGFSSEQGAALKRDVEFLKKQYKSDMEESRIERQKLRKIMEQATALLTRNNADVGAQVERIQLAVDKVSGRVDENENKLREIEQLLTELKAKIEVKLEGSSANAGGTPMPQDKNALYSAGVSAFNSGQQQEARRLLRHFIDSYPDDSRAASSQLLLGNSYFAEQKFAPAIVEYKKILEKYKKSSAVPDALYKIGMSFYQLKFCNDAQLFFKQLIKRFRRHTQTKKAKKILNLIKRYKKNRSVCRP